MRLLIIGPLGGELIEATQIAMERGARVIHADSVDQGLATLRSGGGADLVMIDIDFDIVSLARQMTLERINTELVACGTRSDAQAAVNAIKAGAKDYIPLPPDPELIAAVLQAVCDDRRELIVHDDNMKAVVRLADQIAKSEASVLITGESGTGKEVIARHVHQNSNRSGRPLISVNCAAIPENLLESELFGHEKGAFTGAVARRIGKFEEAHGGTLLLDEVSEMDVRLQAKLLRAIQERVIDRVGGTKPVEVDIRIIATSNRSLQDEVKAGHFREDLFYRLNVVNLKLPPLRERPGDILELARHFVSKYAKLNQLPQREIDPQAADQLQSANWPGNVRELENTMHRAVLLASGAAITCEAILTPDGGQLATRTVSVASQVTATAEAVSRSMVGQTVANVERALILDTLDHCLGNRTHAAKILGISIRTLRNKLNQYADEGVDIPGPGESRLAQAG